MTVGMTVGAIQVWSRDRRCGATLCVVDPFGDLLQLHSGFIQCHQARRQMAEEFFDGGFIHGKKRPGGNRALFNVRMNGGNDD
jgi:hypothetical protein